MKQRFVFGIWHQFSPTWFHLFVDTSVQNHLKMTIHYFVQPTYNRSSQIDEMNLQALLLTHDLSCAKHHFVCSLRKKKRKNKSIKRANNINGGKLVWVRIYFLVIYDLFTGSAFFVVGRCFLSSGHFKIGLVWLIVIFLTIFVFSSSVIGHRSSCRRYKKPKHC